VVFKKILKKESGTDHLTSGKTLRRRQAAALGFVRLGQG